MKTAVTLIINVFTYWINPYWIEAYVPQEEQLAPLVYQKFPGRPLEVAMGNQDQNGYVYVCGHDVMVVVIFEILMIQKVKENLFFRQLWALKEMQRVCQLMIYLIPELQMKQMKQ